MVTAIDSEARKLKLAQQKQSKAKLIMDDESVHAGVKKKTVLLSPAENFVSTFLHSSSSAKSNDVAC
jgi:hypothetical protein